MSRTSKSWVEAHENRPRDQIALIIPKRLELKIGVGWVHEEESWAKAPEEAKPPYTTQYQQKKADRHK